MPTQFQSTGPITAGDALCATIDPVKGIITVSRADAATLANNKTVFGVAGTAPDPLDPHLVSVFLLNEVVPQTVSNITPAVGPSNIVATDHTNPNPGAQAKLRRVPRPDGSEYIVGTCDGNGHTVLQVRASRDTSHRHVFNVRSYGGLPDAKSFLDGAIPAGSSTLTSQSAAFDAGDVGKKVLVASAGADAVDLLATVTAFISPTTVTVAPTAGVGTPSAGAPTVAWTTDNTAAITNAMNAIPASGGTLFFPVGTYAVTSPIAIPSNVHVTFEEGAILAPVAAAVTMAGRVTLHPQQRVFGGIGYSTGVSHPSGAGPLISVTGNPRGHFLFRVMIVTSGGLAAAMFQFSLDDGSTFSSIQTVPATSDYSVPGTGLTIHFPTGMYNAAPAQDVYSWMSCPPIAFSQRSLDHFNINMFGGVPDWDGVPGNLHTDNLAAFNFMMSAIRASGNVRAKNAAARIIAHGKFYFSSTLDIQQTICIEGSGMAEPTVGYGSRSDAGTLFVFPANTTGIRVHSTLADDDGIGAGGFQSGERAKLRDLTVFCKDPIQPVTNNTGHGIHFTAPIFAENVEVAFFANDGFFGYGSVVTNSDGNVDGTVLHTCFASECGRDGFHLVGGDAGGGAFVGCQAYGCRRYGFFDASRENAYLGCHAENNGAPGLDPPIGGDGVGDTGGGHGAEYHTEGSNSSVFVGCYAEGSGTHRSQFLGSVSIFGGTLGETNLTPDSTAFILDHGVASRATLSTLNTSNTTPIQVWLGGNMMDRDPRAAGGHHMDAFKWEVTEADPANLDYTVLRYNDFPVPTPAQPNSAYRWWTLINSDENHRLVMRFPTVQSNARHPAPWFTNGFFVGEQDYPVGRNPAAIHFVAAPVVPTNQPVGSGQTYQEGDIVWSTNPVPGGALGQVCIGKGTLSTLGGLQTTAAATTGAIAIQAQNEPASLSRITHGQYITIQDVPGVYVIDSLVGTTINLETGLLGPTLANKVVEFSPATFTTFGAVENFGASVTKAASVTLLAAERYVTAAVDALTLTLPAAPLDGQTHSIKSKVNAVPPVTTTTVSAAGGTNIDGVATASIAGGQSKTFRYSAAEGQWEIR